MVNSYISDKESFQVAKWTNSLSIVPLEESKFKESAHRGVGNSTITTNDDDAHTPSTNSDENKTQSNDNQNALSSSNSGIEINVSSFNILAESYLTPRSHKNLPESYAEVVFDKSKRRDLLRSILIKLACRFDVLCLQEVDNLLFPMIEECLTQKLDFGYVYSPRNKNEKPDVSNDHSSETSSSENTENNESDERSTMNNDGKKTNKKDSRSDGCATFYNRKKWKCINYQVVQFDDLADESRPPLHCTHDDIQSSKDTEQPIKTNVDKNDSQLDQNSNSDQQQQRQLKQPKAKLAIPGIISSYQRRNTALILRLQKVDSNGSPKLKRKKSQEIVVGNAHLYWHPGYEFVKLSQAHYLLHKIKQFAKVRHDDKDQSENPSYQTSPIIVCGDMNSKPNSVVHQYFTKGHVDARTVAPWYHHYNPELGENQFDNDDELNQDPIVGMNNEDDDANEQTTSKNNNIQTQDGKKDNDSDSLSLSLSVMDLNESSSTIDGGLKPKPLETKAVRQTKRIPSYEEDDDGDSSTTPKYLLDITLNKLTRWLRIMGLDAELENEEEEKARTGDGKM